MYEWILIVGIWTGEQFYTREFTMPDLSICLATQPTLEETPATKDWVVQKFCYPRMAEKKPI